MLLPARQVTFSLKPRLFPFQKTLAWQGSSCGENQAGHHLEKSCATRSHCFTWMAMMGLDVIISSWLHLSWNGRISLFFYFFVDTCTQSMNHLQSLPPLFFETGSVCLSSNLELASELQGSPCLYTSATFQPRAAVNGFIRRGWRLELRSSWLDNRHFIRAFSSAPKSSRDDSLLGKYEKLCRHHISPLCFSPIGRTFKSWYFLA